MYKQVIVLRKDLKMGLGKSIVQACHASLGAYKRAKPTARKLWEREGAKKVVVKVDPAYFRPTEVELLIGDPTKAKEKLGWEPEYDLPALVKDMMESDIDLMKREKYLKDGGHRVMNYFE